MVGSKDKVGWPLKEHELQQALRKMPARAALQCSGLEGVKASGSVGGC